MFIADYHTHSNFSSDSDTPLEENIKKAVSLGLKEIACTDHIDYDYPDPEYPFLFEYEPYIKEIDRLKKKYTEIKIKTGVEIGIQPHVIDKINNLVSNNYFDFVIASTHVAQDGLDLCANEFFEGKSKHQAFTDYFEEVLSNVKNYDFFNVYGHIDFINRYGSYEDKTMDYYEFKSLTDEILKTIISKGKGIEINTSGYRYGLGHPHPQFELIKRYKELGGEIITVGSDAHKPEQITFKFDKAYEMLKEAGFKYITLFTDRKPEFVKF